MSNNIKTIILANATIRSGNKGCVALCYSIIYLIDNILAQKGIEYRLYLTDSKEKEGTHSVNICGKTILFESIDYPMQNSWINTVKHISKNLKLYKIFKQADYIMDIGQGDSFADIYGAYRFNKIDRIHRVARFLSKPYILLPQTIGPFTNPAVRGKAIKSITGASLVMTRDGQSLDYVKELAGNKAHVKEFIDVAFFLPYTKMDFDNNFVHVGVNISGLLWNGGYTRDNQFGLKTDYQQIMRKVLAWYLTQDNVKIHLISHAMTGERKVENDYEVAFDLWKTLHHDRLVLAPLFFSPIEAKNYIAGMDFFMGARMHATIAAFSAGVPVIPMAYSRKFNGLFIDTLSYSHLIDLKEDDESTILTMVKEDFSNRDRLQQEIADQMRTTVSTQKEKLFNELTAYLCS
jgi:polysaccharide pyruvyl transferase WcaK-like protein